MSVNTLIQTPINKKKTNNKEEEFSLIKYMINPTKVELNILKSNGVIVLINLERQLELWGLNPETLTTRQNKNDYMSLKQQ